MAQCQWQPNFRTLLKKDVSWKCRGLEVSINRGRGLCNWRKRLQKPQCSSSSFPVSSTTARELDQVGLKLEGKQRGECLVNDNYGWKVRRMIETEQEMRKVAAVQAEAFHQPLFFFDDLFFEFFQVHSKHSLLLHFVDLFSSSKDPHVLFFLIFQAVLIFAVIHKRAHQFGLSLPSNLFNITIV